jgi:hypothetical protein
MFTEGMFRAYILGLFLFGLLCGVGGAVICLYVIPFFYHHIHWVK